MKQHIPWNLELEISWPEKRPPPGAKSSDPEKVVDARRAQATPPLQLWGFEANMGRKDDIWRHHGMESDMFIYHNICIYIYIHIWTAIWLGACPWPPFDYHANAKMRFQTTCFPTKPLKNEHEPLESRQMQQEMKNEPVTACRIEVNMY